MRSASRRPGRGVRLLAVLAVATMTATACPPDAGPPTPVVPTIEMVPNLSRGWYSMPWPNAIRRTDAGMTDWTALPGIASDIFTEPLPPIPILPAIVEKAQTTVNQFGRSTAVFFQANVELAGSSLPSPAQSTTPGSSVMLMNLATGELAPLVVVNQERQDRFRPAHLLTLLPYPGHQLANDAEYAALVFDGVTGTDGTALAPSSAIAQLGQAYDPAMPMTAAQHSALGDQLAQVTAAIGAHTSHDVGDLVAFSVYRTQDTGREWNAVTSAMADLPTPTVAVDSVGPCAASSLDGPGDFSIVKAHVTLPVWRNGTFPYLFEGGKLIVQPNGKAQQFGSRVAPVELQIPCAGQTMPAGGFPIVTHVDGTGGDQQIAGDYTVTRRAGVVYGKIAPLYGDGVGDAGTILAPFGFTTPRSQKEVLFYNLLNPDAIRSNPLQQAADHLMFTRALEQFAISGAAFGQPGTIVTDPNRVVITGHSQGAQTLAMVAQADPSIGGVVSSAGSGGQYHTLAHSPRRLSTISLVTTAPDRIDELNPLLHMVQTVFEASDGANFPNDTNFLNYVNYGDTCTTVETGTHYSRAQNLALVKYPANSPEISYGDPSLDRINLTLPIAANVGGKTRVSVMLPGGHYNYVYNVAQSTAFQNQVFQGVTPSVPQQSYGYNTSWNCPGERYDDPPRLFGI